MKVRLSIILLIFSVTLLTSGLWLNEEVEVTYADPVFTINLLHPNTNPARNAWAKLIAEELPKIGIATNLTGTGWDVIGPRTFSHQRDGSDAHTDFYGNTVGAIPSYDDGGFDIFFVGLSGALDYNPTWSYSTAGYSPSGNNFASYENVEISTLINEYTSELEPAQRALIAPQIQQYAYDDQPYINVVNTAGVWAYDAAWTSLRPIDLIFFGSTNKADGWKDLSHPSETDIVYAHSYELTEFIPFAIQSYIAAQYMNPIYPGLYERDPDDVNKAFAPVMAKSLPTWNDNKTIATIEVRDDMTFSDGEAVTVEDIVNSFHMHMTPAWSVGSYAGLTTYIDTNDSVSVVNSTHMEIKLIDPYFLAVGLMGVSVFDIDDVGTPSATTSYGGVTAVGPKGDGTNNYDFNTNAYKFSGAGPFKYAIDGIDATAGDVKLERVTDYWNGGDGTLQTIQFNKYGSKLAALSHLQGGEIHIIDAEFYLEPGEVEGLVGVDYEIVADFGTQMMTINMDHPILGTGIDTPLGQADPSRAEEAARYIRQAISHLVPRDYIVDDILKGVGLAGTTLWPQLALGYNNSLEPFTYDIELARSYMEMAGYSMNIFTSTTTITSSSSQTTSIPITTTSYPPPTTTYPTTTTSYPPPTTTYPTTTTSYPPPTTTYPTTTTSNPTTTTSYPPPTSSYPTTTTNNPTTTTSIPTTTTSDSTTTTSIPTTTTNDPTTPTVSLSLALVPILFGVVSAAILLRLKNFKI
ncbi:MAG: ABC transporter substrate-binding protein [Candidatus Kariarchaeaceae archaeon]|jgi:ABC-type transport system substrate-binding protein